MTNTECLGNIKIFIYNISKQFLIPVSAALEHVAEPVCKRLLLSIFRNRRSASATAFLFHKAPVRSPGPNPQFRPLDWTAVRAKCRSNTGPGQGALHRSRHRQASPHIGRPGESYITVWWGESYIEAMKPPSGDQRPRVSIPIHTAT